MNSYPAELVNHHYACMFVAGLLPIRRASGGAADPSRSATDGSADASSSTSAQNGTTMARNDASEASTSASSQPSSAPADAFPVLASDLCDLFRSRGRSTAWDPAQGQSAAFHTVLVDHNVRLPPRKTRPVARSLTGTTTDEQSGLANLPARSPLSPIHPSSPLFPDGIIAPIWLRKHRELVPAVYVAFFCLAEPRQDDGSEERVTAQGTGTESPTRSRVSTAAIQELKTRDEELIQTISDRKRLLNERGIKMTVVLLTTRQMLESSALESRLSYIRRSSQLDSRASLFVLTPVSRAELSDFVTSLHSALYDAALDYYREHYRRVRRKRTRYPPNPSMVAQIMKATGETRGSPVKDLPLSREGWLVRNNYKLGSFAELSANMEDAIANYTTAYNTLAYELLPSTMLLPPRTRRWAEAKVLADTLSVRLSRLHLCRGNGNEAWSQLRAHIKRFTELSQGWGIGETTFEFWSWLGKQYRLMGDLLDQAMREVPGAPLPPFRPAVHFPPLPTFLLHPSHLPTPTASGSVLPSYNPQHGTLAVPNEAAVASGCVTTTMSLGAGDCYYVAGLCALERWQRYKKMLWDEKQQQHQRKPSVDGIDGEQDSWMSTNLAQERKVDHAAQAIDALTKAHDAFKREGRQRSSLSVASKIVNAYLDTEHYEVALRFLERIVKTYHSEAWAGPLLSQMLLAWTSAEQLKDRDRQVRLLWTLLSSSALADKSVRAAALQELCGLEQGTTTPQAQTLAIEHDNTLLSVEVVFARSEMALDSRPVPFQLRISSRANAMTGRTSFDSMRIEMSDGQSSLLIRNKASVAASSVVSIGGVKVSNEKDVDGGTIDLSWTAGSVRAIQGTLLPTSTGVLSFASVSMHKEGSAPIILRLDLVDRNDEGQRTSPRWLVSADPIRYVYLHTREHADYVLVKPREYKVKVVAQHDDIAYVEEAFAVRVTVCNDDKIPLACNMSVQVLGGTASLTSKIQGGDNSLADESIGSIAPGSSQTTVVYISFTHDATQAQAEVLIRAVHTDAAAGDALGSEVRAIISPPVRQPFSASYSAQWKQVVRSGALNTLSAPDDDTVSLSSMTTGGDLQAATATGDGSANKGAVAKFNAAITVHAEEAFAIRCVRLVVNPDNRHIKLLGPLMAQKDVAATESVRQEQETHVEGTWLSGDRWGGSYDMEALAESSVGTQIEGEDGNIAETGHLEVEWSRATRGDATVAVWNTARLALPLLLPPHLLSRLVVSLPTIVSNEQAFVMLVTIVNPSKLPSDVLISIDDSHADFTVLSHKSFTVPNLLPRSTRSIPLHLSSRAAGLVGSGAQTPLASPRQSQSTRQERSNSPAPTLRVLPSIRAWQRDRREVLQLQQERQQQAGQAADASMSRTASKQGFGRPPIVNARPGIGVPLNVLLRYTTSSKPGASSATLNVVDPSIPARPLSASGTHEVGQSGDLATRLRHENERSGLWTVLVQG